MAEKKGFFGRLFKPGQDLDDASESEPSEELAHAGASGDPAPGPDLAPGPAPLIEAEPRPTSVIPSMLEPEEAAPSTADPEPSIDLDPIDAARETPDAPEGKQSWFGRLKSGLSKSSGAISTGITSIFTKRKLDDDMLQDLEDILIQADLGVTTAGAITERLALERYDKNVDQDDVRAILASEVEKVLTPVAVPLALETEAKPAVILIVGVNGSGKTTTIGKLAEKFRTTGKSVMLAAGDTFRAAAIEQLKVWGQRTGSTVIARDQGSDAAGLAFDAMVEAKDAGTDILLIDTAGRLQNRTELMAELEKVVKVIRRHDETAPHAVLLTLDATTGQNALNQVEVFKDKVGVTGLVMTKLDGTARGGILVAIAGRFGLPIHFIGVGEGVDDLEPFKAEDFAQAIAGMQ